MHFQTPASKPTSKEIDLKVEFELQEWILSQRPKKISSTEIREKAKSLFQCHGRTEIQCSYGWYRRFMTRMQKNEECQVLKSRIGRHTSNDNPILKWLLSQYDNNQLVSYKDLQSYSQSVLQESLPNFKASAGWALRFLKRNHLIIKLDGLYTETLPLCIAKDGNQFHTEIKQLIIQSKHLPSNVGCMDEIPVTFSCPKFRANLERGQLQVGAVERHEADMSAPLLRNISIKNCDATVILGLLADGTLLPPMVIVKVSSKTLLILHYS